MRLHLISGLPRSGSTLLAAILRQNPRFHAGIQSPLAGLISAAIRAMSAHESASFISNEQRLDVLSGIVNAYYRGYAHLDVVFDSNRTWCSLIAAMSAICPAVKVICCVRSPAWILDSMERLHQQNPLILSSLYNDEVGSVFTRVERLVKGFIGLPLGGVLGACHGAHAERIIIVPYDALASDPSRVIRRLYQILDLPQFEHRFDKVELDEPEFDAHLGMPGLHRVTGPVVPKHRATILPEEIFKRHHAEFWTGLAKPLGGPTII